MFQQLSTTWLVQEQSLAGSSSAVPFRLDRRPTCKLMKLNMRDAFCSSGNRLQSCWPLTWIVARPRRRYGVGRDHEGNCAVASSGGPGGNRDPRSSAERRPYTIGGGCN